MTRERHGQHGTPLYYVWKSMRQRCRDAECEAFRWYGAKGVAVCEPWSKFSAFFAWAQSSGYRRGLQLDRKDNSGPYSPDNCRWTTGKVNSNNRSNNVLLTAFGRTMTLAEWADVSGLSWSRIRDRVFKLGWPVEQALTVPKSNRWSDRQAVVA